MSLLSRTDFWLISKDLVPVVGGILIEPAILTDHKGIFIKIILAKNNTGYWKFNNLLLKNADLIVENNIIIDKYWNKVCITGSSGYFWELMKYDIRRAELKKGKFMANWKKTERN